MTNKEALEMASKLGIDLSTVKYGKAVALAFKMEDAGFELGVDNQTGDWVAIEKTSGEVKVRVQ